MRLQFVGFLKPVIKVKLSFLIKVFYRFVKFKSIFMKEGMHQNEEVESLTRQSVTLCKV